MLERFVPRVLAMDAAVRRDVPPCGIPSSGWDWGEVKGGCWDWGGWEVEGGEVCGGGGVGAWSSGSWLWSTYEERGLRERATV